MKMKTVSEFTLHLYLSETFFQDFKFINASFVSHFFKKAMGLAHPLNHFQVACQIIFAVWAVNPDLDS